MVRQVSKKQINKGTKESRGLDELNNQEAQKIQATRTEAQDRRKEEFGLLLLLNNIYIVAKVFRESPLF